MIHASMYTRVLHQVCWVPESESKRHAPRDPYVHLDVCTTSLHAHPVLDENSVAPSFAVCQTACPTTSQQQLTLPVFD